MDPTGRKGERELQPILPAGIAEARASAGFTLIEVVCVLAIVAMLAAIVLPAMPRNTSHQRLEGYAIETAALLNADQQSARRQHRDVATVVDAPARVIRSGASGWTVRVPPDVMMEALLASRCKDRPAGAAIHHLASGMSCGGVVTMTRHGGGFQIKVNWLTGGAEVVPIH
jgi:general secretion pathway protein H